MSLPRVYAIVPAAGRGRRMGAAKQLLEVSGQTMLQGVVEALAASAVEGVVLVTHSEIVRALGTWQAARTWIVLNDDETSAMIDSLRLGLQAWSERVELRAPDGVLVYPADQPGITPAEIDVCIDAFRVDAGRIVVASHGGRRGHPLVFPASLVPFACSAACDEGLNALPRTHAERLHVVECDSPAVTRDIDTPEDYRRIIESDHTK